MFREKLLPQRGMLFIYEKEAIRSFWMKNVNFPLDIIFINSDFEIIDIISAKPCKSPPCKRYLPKEKFLYALEINPGEISKKFIGKKIKIKL